MKDLKISILGCAGILALLISVGPAAAQTTKTQPSMKRSQMAQRASVTRPLPATPRRIMTLSVPMGMQSRSSKPMLSRSEVMLQSLMQQLPKMDKVNPGPFAVEQNRRFERGETPVPASLHTF